ADQLQTPDFEIGVKEVQGIKNATVPPLSGKAALLLDFASNSVLYSKAPHQPLPPASTTKIMTALLTFEQGGLDDQTSVSAVAAAEPGTRMDLAAGERFSVRELLYGLLLPSGNDAALTLAERNAGSIPAFVDRMNARAKALSLNETHYGDPDGIDDADDRMSVWDVSQLARFTLVNQSLFDQIVATAHFSLPAQPGHPAFDLTNLNQLLGNYPGADGVKTGTTPGAGENLVGSATRNGHRLMMVVYGSQDRYTDARKLLDTGFASWVWLQPAKALPTGVAVQLTNPGEVLMPAWEAPEVHAFLDPDAQAAAFTLAGRTLMTVPAKL
ncbi:MAG TPA: D-alanyl-D-alanine carboxypeptidase family protein, partial [Chloroflexota bacterium]|nr:D-alanyl-D-alanine carboxypeptidase family protein [Chloroflexota bacterium]